MPTQISYQKWTGGEGLNDPNISIGYCQEEPFEVLKKVIKVVVSSAIFCITFFIFPLICFSFYLLISPFFALRSQNHRTIFSDNKLVFVLT